MLQIVEHDASLKLRGRERMIRHNLKSWRERHNKGRGISKAHLARKIGINRSYITRLEQNEIEPSSKIMFRIADYFGCKVDDIFKYSEDKAR